MELKMSKFIYLFTKFVPEDHKKQNKYTKERGARKKKNCFYP